MTDDPKDERPDANGLSDQERDKFLRRASALGKKLDEYREEHERPRRPKPSSNSAFGDAMKLAIEPLVGVLFGLGVGLALDHWLGTKPIFLIVFLLLGAAAGMLNMMRSAMGTSTTRKPTAPGDDQGPAA